MKNRSCESSIAKENEKHIREYIGRDFGSILKEFSDYPLHLTYHGKGSYPLNIYIKTPQGSMELCFQDFCVKEAHFFPYQSS